MSAAVSVQDGVYAALVADASLLAFLAPTAAGNFRIYEVMAPPGTRLVTDAGAAHPYITISGGTEADFRTMCREGYEDTLRVRVWVPGSNERLAKVGYAHVKRVLEAGLVVAGYTHLGCDVVLERTLTDPDGGATQAIAGVTVYARVV